MSPVVRLVAADMFGKARGAEYVRLIRAATFVAVVADEQCAADQIQATLPHGGEDVVSLACHPSREDDVREMVARLRGSGQ